MFADLYKFSEKHGLATAFKAVGVYNALDIDNLTIESFKEARDIEVPKESRSSDIKPYLGYDWPEYLYGTGARKPKKGGKQKKGGKPKEVVMSACEAFWKRMLEVCREAGDTEAQRLVENPDKFRQIVLKGEMLARVQAAQEDKKSQTKKARCSTGLRIGGEWWVQRPCIRQYIEEIGGGAFELSVEHQHCLVTGEKGPVITGPHPHVRNIHGTSMPMALTSWQKGPLHESFRTAPGIKLFQGANFPVLPKVAIGYTSAVDYLATNQAVNLGDKPDVCLSILLYGPDGAKSVSQAMSRYTKDDELAAAWAGVEAMRDSDEPLSILALKGGARISVMDFQIRPAREVVASLLRFRRHYHEWGADTEHVFSVSRELENTGTKVKPMFDTSLKLSVCMALLTGRPFPSEAFRVLTHGINPRGLLKSNTVRQTRTQLRWMAFAQSIDDNTPPQEVKMESQKKNERPLVEQFVHPYTKDEVDRSLTGVPLFHVFGQMAALLQEMKSRYLGRKTDSSIASTINWVSCNLPSWKKEATKKHAIYRTRMSPRNVFDREILEQYDRLLVIVSSIPEGFANSAQMGSFSLGMDQEGAFIRAFKSWFFDGIREKKALAAEAKKALEAEKRAAKDLPAAA